MGNNVTEDSTDRFLARVSLNPLYEPRRAHYTIIGEAFTFPLVVGNLHTIHADLCVLDGDTCQPKPTPAASGSAPATMPVYAIPLPETGEDPWIDLSATWWGTLTLEEQGAQSGGPQGKEMPHPKGVLSSLKDGDELQHLQQRLTWKLVEPANRIDLLVVEEPVIDDAPFQHTVPFARLNSAEGNVFEVELAVEGGDGERLVVDKVCLVPKEPLLVPNYGRDRTIDEADQQRVLNKESVYFWVNDNFDTSVVKKAGGVGADVPCQLYSREWEPSGICATPWLMNWMNDRVDSVRDLLDFFPVWVNIEAALINFPAAEYQYVLKQADGALNAVIFPGVNRLHANGYLRDLAVATNELGQAQVIQISSDGYILPETFLTMDAERRVILLEGRTVTSQPLVLEIQRRTDDHVMLTEDMPLLLLNVEEMFRHKTLRPEPNMYADRLTTKLPETFFDNTTLVHVHGFKADEEGLRGTVSAVFKRLWQTGFNGKFWYVSWNSEALYLQVAHYHNATVNAFAYAGQLAEFLRQLAVNGPVDVTAFSLGNLLTSVAIADYDPPVRNYYALEAAVALEAYGTGGDAKGLPEPMYDHDRSYMVSPKRFEGTSQSYAWQDYAVEVDYPGETSRIAEDVYASEWYRLFADDPGDERRTLTWRNRLRLDHRTGTTAYNFYSSTEDVLGVSRHPNGMWTIFQEWLFKTWNAKFYVWQVQELLKGVDIVIPNFGGGSDPYAGWDFAYWGTSHSKIDTTNAPMLRTDIITTPEVVKAKLESPTERGDFLSLLKTDPLFQHTPDILFTAQEGRTFVSGKVKDYANDTVNLLNYGKGKAPDVQEVKIRDWLLAKAFQARTGPLGSRENAAWGLKNNFEMTSDKIMTSMKDWPRRPFNDQPAWWHTDYEDVAYLHVWKLYQKLVDCVQKGACQHE